MLALALAVVAVALSVLGIRMWSTFASAASQYDIAEVEKMEAASEIVDRNGVSLGHIQAINRRPVPLSGMSRWLPAAALAAEDARFREHPGIDPVGILRAAIQNFRHRGIRQGASTITQQLVRDSFNIREKTYKRKLLEAALALRLESTMTKDRILELYLNRIYFGSGLYGVESASMGYYGKSSSELNPSEAAQLMGLVRSPNASSPWRNPDRAESVRRLVLGQMAEQGALTPSELGEWLSRPPKIRPKQMGKGDSYVVEAVRLEVSKIVDPDLVMSGGLKIRTTLDSALQKSAETAVREHTAMIEAMPEMKGSPTMAEFSLELEKSPPVPGAPNRMVPSYVQAAAAAVDNSTGGILALVGGRSFWHSEYNRATQSRRLPGGLFAPFVALAALDSGIPSHQTFDDWPLDNRFVGVGGAEGVMGEWGVESEKNAYEGPLSMRRLLASGKNAALARLGFAAGSDAVSGMAHRAGFAAEKALMPSSYVQGPPASPVELALAYTCFPRLGTRPSSAYLVEEIISPLGKVVYSHTPSETNVSTQGSAWLLSDILREGLDRGPASRVRDFWPSCSGVGVRSGTSYGFEDSWFAGYDSAISLAVWVGFDKPSRIFRGAFGSAIAAPIWSQIMRSRPSSPITQSSPPAGVGRYEICPSGGGLLSGACPPPSSELFEFSAAPGPSPCSVHSTAAPGIEREEGSTQWPRAQQLVDTRTIRPVGIEEGYITPSADPYGSVSPASMGKAAVRVEPAVTPVPPTTVTPSPETPSPETPSPETPSPETLDP